LQGVLVGMEAFELAKTLISGTMPDKTMIFAPIPNFIFTRDIGITINDHILLNKPAKIARTREALLTQYIFYNHPMFAHLQDRIIEIPESEHHFLLPDGEKDYKRATLEGGDVMIVSKNHLLIGISERTSPYAVNQVIKILFEKDVVQKVSVLKIPKKRDYMHIDTIFTQVKKNVWVLLGALSRKGQEQWTDSCNLLAIKEGVVVGYDRNDRTADAFREAGFNVIRATELLQKFERGETEPEKIKDTLILLPSAELSRARGGSHCMSMPLLREDL
jgi:arginine deiminase